MTIHKTTARNATKPGVQILAILTCTMLAWAAQAVDFNFQQNGQNVDLTPTSVFTAGGLSITASGFNNSGTASDLFSKVTTGDPGETGLGMTVDSGLDNEIDSSHFIQLNLSDLAPSVSTVIGLSSVQPGESAIVYATKTPGSPVTAVGSIVIQTLTVDGTVDVTSFVNNGYFIDITAGSGNVLIISLASTQPSQPLAKGDTATIGFWHNKNGQALINSLNGGPNSTALGTWLASNFGCLFGNLNGQNNSTVAAQFLTDFNVTGQKTYAQILATALASYVTSSTLAGGTMAGPYGFTVSTGGTGDKLFNVGSDGAAIGLVNNTSYTIMQLLEAANANCSGGSITTPAAFNALNDIFDAINQGGDI